MDQFDSTTLFSDYKIFHSPAIKLSKMGRPSGGVVVFVKNFLLKHIKEIECNFDNLITIKLSNAILKSEKDMFLSFAYIPPYKSNYYKNKEIQCAIDNLQDHLLNITEN